MNKHGECKKGKNTPEYSAWISMFHRCYTPSNEQYKNYGGRGIQVCLRWHRGTENALQNFISDLGRKPSPNFTLGRINNDVSYMPSNCRWETPNQQSNNRRERRGGFCKRGHKLSGWNALITVDGFRHCRTCGNARHRRWKKENRLYIKDYNRKYFDENRVAINAARRRRYSLK